MNKCRALFQCFCYWLLTSECELIIWFCSSKKTPGVHKEAAIQKSSLIYVVVKSRQILEKSEAVVQRCSVKKVFLEVSQNSQENTCVKVSFLCNFIKKETLAQVFSFERCEISKNTFSYECFLQSTLVAASENWESDFSSFAKIFSKDIFQGLLLLHIMSKSFELW